MGHPRRFALSLTLLCGLAIAASAQNSDLHELRWYVHADMVTANEPLSFWQGFIEEANANAEILYKGNQGSDTDPDAACCSELTLVSVGTYGSAGDGLDMPSGTQFGTMRAAIQGGDPGGSVAFLVRAIALCGTSANAIGCALTPPCNSNANDDPDLHLMVSVEAMQDDDADFVPEGVGQMGQTLGHERGHNACLNHVTSNPCQLMAPAGDGGCLSTSECTDLQEARTTTSQGDACECHAVSNTVVADGLACNEGAVAGTCSGGVCATSGGFGQVELFAAGAPEAIEIGEPLDEVTDDLQLASDLPGGWVDSGDYAAAIQGLAYDPGRQVVWGVLDNGANDQIVQIDPTSGAITSTLTTLSGHPNVIALAFHPGASASGDDDHLLANSAEPEVDCDLVFSPPDFCAGELLEIDPSDGSFQSVGGMNFSFVGGLRGLAYDSTRDILYGSAFAGGSLWEFTNLTCTSTSCSCPGSFCTVAEQTAVSLPRIVSGLAYSPESDRLYLSGSQSGPQQLQNSIDAATFETTARIGVDGYTTGGLAAVPLPEPAAPLAWLIGCGAVAVLARGRSRGLR